MKISTTFDTPNLTAVENRIKNPTRYFQAGVEILKASIVKNFEAQGRPNRWKPLAEATLLAGAGYGGQRFTKGGSASKGFERHLQGRQILILRGKLRNSITGEATSRHGIVGSNEPQAALQHFGGQAGRGHQVYVPARKFVMFQKEDVWALNALLRRFVVVGQ
jgi:phage gpG-like protein